MTGGRSAVVTLAMGRAVENLGRTFTSFQMNVGVDLHAFVLGSHLPVQRLPRVSYHLLAPSPDFSHPLREVYYRRLEAIDELDVDYALVVDALDVLCLQPLPSFAQLLGDAVVAACVEHQGGRRLLGQGYTANYFNGGVFLWNVAATRDIRKEMVERGRSRFRTIVDDQCSVNEVLQTKYFDRVRILPCQYNYRAFLNRRRRGWPTVNHLDGVMIYHNGDCIEAAKELLPVAARAALPPLPDDQGPVSRGRMMLRRLMFRMRSDIIH